MIGNFSAQLHVKLTVGPGEVELVVKIPLVLVATRGGPVSLLLLSV